MGKLLYSTDDKAHRDSSAAANDYLHTLYGQVINPDAPMRYDPPMRDRHRKVPFRKFFYYF